MKRIRDFHMVFTEREFEMLCSLAENDPDTHTKKGNEKNISAYIRKKIFSGAARPEDLRKELGNLAYQIRKIGVNINQVTAKINSSYATGNDVKLLEGYLHDVENSFWEMARKIEGIYGNH